MIVREPDNLCVICGAVIPEERQVCPICGQSEAEHFEKAMSRKLEQPEFKPDDAIEQSFRQGYTTGFTEGMKAACEIKQENERLKRRIIILEQQASRAVHDIDAEYE